MKHFVEDDIEAEKYTKQNKLESMARFNGFIKKSEILELLKKYNFLGKDKLIREIKRR